MHLVQQMQHKHPIFGWDHCECSCIAVRVHYVRCHRFVPEKMRTNADVATGMRRNAASTDTRQNFVISQHVRYGTLQHFCDKTLGHNLYLWD